MCLWSLRHCSLESCQNITLCHGGKKLAGQPGRVPELQQLVVVKGVQTHLQHLASCKKQSGIWERIVTDRITVGLQGMPVLPRCPSSVPLPAFSPPSIESPCLQPGCVAVLLLLPGAPTLLGHSLVPGSSPCLPAVLCAYVCVSGVCITALRFPPGIHTFR